MKANLLARFSAGAILLSQVASLTVEYKAKYFTDTTLICNDTALQLPYTTFLKYWILPNGTLLQWSFPGDRKYKIGAAPGFNLTISNIDDPDFDWYYCVILWDNYIYLTHSIKVGLNVNGADYDDLYSVYKSSAVIGGIAGASVALILSLCCLVYWCKYSEVNTENKENTSTTVSDSKTCSSADSCVSKNEAEQEAIYVLEKAVKSFDEETYKTHSQDSCASRRRGFDLRRLGSFTGDSLEETLPPPPPLSSLSDDASQHAEIVDMYDRVPPGTRTSVPQHGVEGDVYAQPSDCAAYINPGLELEEGEVETSLKTIIGAVDILDSSEFQEHIVDEHL